MVGSLFLIMECTSRFGRRKSLQVQAEDKLEKTIGTITGAMLALFGFLLAVSISMADSQFESRRKLILDEANAIGTSTLRAQTIGGQHGREIKRLLVDYTQLRLDFFEAGEEKTKLKTIYDRTAVLQQQIWRHASAIAEASPTPISALLLSSLNEVIDLSTSRRWALEVRVPPFIIKLLFIFSILSLGLLG